MPTGYTAPVVDGEITSLKEFAKRCARAFGTFILMRDKPLDAALPTKIDPDVTFYDRRISECEEEIKRLNALEGDRLYLAHAAEQARLADLKAEHVKLVETNNKRLDDMRAKVESWNECLPEMRQFMLEQLGISKEEIWLEPETHENETAEEWRERLLEKHHEDIEYWQKMRAEEVARAHDKQKWLDDFYKSLETAE